MNKEILDIPSVKKNVRRFLWEKNRWQNYMRDYYDKNSDIKYLYWLCVVRDVMAFHKGMYEGTKIEANRRLAMRIYRSFNCCFFDAHKLNEKLLAKFDGLHTYYSDAQRDEWDQWVEHIGERQAKYLSNIKETIKIQVENRVLIKPTQEVLKYNITAFDEQHSQLAQKPSNELAAHLKHGNVARERGTSNAVFKFKIEKEFVEILHEHGISYFLDMFLYQMTGRIQKQFKEKKIIKRKIELSENQTIEDAIKDHLGKWPEFEQLQDSELAKVIQHRYADKSGKELNYKSIKKALRRMKNKKE